MGLIAFLRCGNWVSPLVGIIQDVTRDSVHIEFSQVSVNEAKQRLAEADIEHWNDHIDRDYGYVCVAPGDARRAARILKGRIL